MLMCRRVVSAVKLKFHGTDSDTDIETDFLADFRASPVEFKLNTCTSERRVLIVGVTVCTTTTASSSSNSSICER